MSDHLAKIDAAFLKVLEATAEHRRVLMEEQIACNHPLEAIVRGDYLPEGMITRAQPPFLVCRHCGYAEEEWGCGTWRIRHQDAPRLSREEAFKLVRGSLKTQRRINQVRFDGAPLESLWRRDSE